MWVKICGITCSEDAHLVVAAGGSAIGLNFYPGSKRFVTSDIARQIAGAVGDQVDVVGVFVNTPPDEVASMVHNTGLNAVQFHGDESVDQINHFRDLCPETPVIRAMRIGAGAAGCASQIRNLTMLNRPPDAVLVDAFVTGEYGGTGQSIAADKRLAEATSLHRVILAGGLTPDNVEAAIEQIYPWGVDTASGVETEPGRKSEDLVRRFVDACRDHGSARRLQSANGS